MNNQKLHLLALTKKKLSRSVWDVSRIHNEGEERDISQGKGSTKGLFILKKKMISILKDLYKQEAQNFTIISFISTVHVTDAWMFSNTVYNHMMIFLLCKS